MSDSSGNPVIGSGTRFFPFGGYRTMPTAGLTDRGFTGHLHNDPLGLVYMNARYYVPSIGRFASADTIVPDPNNPQGFNRYAYVNNSPLNSIDPSGHCEGNPQSGDDYDYDYACWEYAYQLRDSLGMEIGLLGLLNLEQLRFFELAINEISGMDASLATSVIETLNESVVAHDLVEKMKPGGWDALGVRLGGGASAGLGGDGNLDFVFNFHALEFTILASLNGSIGAQAGASGGPGAYLGFNAPTNDAFTGWGSGMSISIAIAEYGGTVQGGVSGKMFLLGNAIPCHSVESTDPMFLAVQYTPGVEIGFSVGIGYTWNLYTYEYRTP